MGLDSYFYIKRRQSEEEKERMVNQLPEELRSRISDKKSWISESSTYTEALVGYFRKFNAMHGFIVDKYSRDGEDNCQPIYLYQDELEEIKDTVDDVLGHEGEDDFVEYAKEHFPCRQGFFFGANGDDGDYGEWYVRDCHELSELMSTLIKSMQEDDSIVSVIYSASW